MDELLDFIVKYMPSPVDGEPAATALKRIAGQNFQPTDGGFSAYMFKCIGDRSWDGCHTCAYIPAVLMPMVLYIIRAKIRTVYEDVQVFGKEQRPIDKAFAAISERFPNWRMSISAIRSLPWRNHSAPEVVRNRWFL